MLSASRVWEDKLFVAAWKGDYDRVEMILNHSVPLQNQRVSVNVNYDWYDGYTPLHLACCRGHLSIVKLLLDKHAAVNCASNDGRTPLQLACKGPSKWLPGDTPSSQDFLSIVKLLLDHQADINWKDDDGDTALHWASDSNQVDILRLLLSTGLADCTIANKKDQKPEDLARRRNYTDVIELLHQEKQLQLRRDAFAWLKNDWKPVVKYYRKSKRLPLYRNVSTTKKRRKKMRE